MATLYKLLNKKTHIINIFSNLLVTKNLKNIFPSFKNHRINTYVSLQNQRPKYFEVYWLRRRSTYVYLYLSLTKILIKH